MTVKISFEMEGMAALHQLLREIPEDTRVQINRPSAREMGAEVFKRSKDLVPQPGKSKLATGALLKALRMVRHKRNPPWIESFGVGVVVAKKGKVVKGKGGAPDANNPYYWHMVEFGGARGRQQSFIRAAVERDPQALLQLFQDGFAKRLKRKAADWHRKQSISVRRRAGK